MKARRWGLGLAGLLLLLVSVWQNLAVTRGLTIIRQPSLSPPLTIIKSPQEEQQHRPLILIGHGFAGSELLMRGFALTLAHAGYTAVLWDFDGHGANPQPLPQETQNDSLLTNAEIALAEAADHGFGDKDRVAILGHSMGSGVALSFGQQHPKTGATIAVSPVGQPVTPELPRNLLLMAGSLETPFVRNAEQRLAEAGGPDGDLAVGTARKLVIVPNVEHISILFSPTAHATARDWLDATFGVQPGARAYTDRRILWYGLGLLGVLLIASVLAPLVAEPKTITTSKQSLWRRLSALLSAALGATLILWLTGQVGLNLRNLLGLLVGGYLMVWFGVAGLLALLLLAQRPPRPSGRSVLAGLLAFAALWLGVGLLGQLVWLPWLLIPRRLVLWPIGALLLLPWFLAVGEAAKGTNVVRKVGWWLAHSAILAGSMFLALQLSPELGFLILILPLFPIILALHALVTGPYRGSWPFALSGALFTSWLLLAVFPLQW
jgi:pimeloyl-ACP methyl ester carboxylesterase